jgi:hypothetical protein
MLSFNKLSSWVITGLAVLAGLLPINNVLSQFFVIRLGLPALLTTWKELLVIGICLVMIGQILYIWKKTRLSGKEILRSSWLIILYIVLVILALASSVVNQVDVRGLILGFRVELFWLGFFVVSSIWVKTISSYGDQNLGTWVRRILQGAMIGLGIVTLVSGLILIFGGSTILPNLGFGDTWSTEDQLTIESPTCHRLDESGTCRLTGGFPTPNHFASYLLLALPLFFTFALRNPRIKKWYIVVLGILGMIAMLLFSYSRAAWVALAASVGILGLLWLGKKLSSQISAKITIGISIAAMAAPIILWVGLLGLEAQTDTSMLTNILGRPLSTNAHAKRTLASVEILEQNPDRLVFGYGLGQSGPTSLAQYGLSVESEFAQENQTIAQEFGIKPYEIGIPENWYLQLVLNGGLLYAIGYIIILFIPLRELLTSMNIYLVDKKSTSSNMESIIYGLAFYGIVLCNLVLHVWSNQTVALYWGIVYVVWYLLRKTTSQATEAGSLNLSDKTSIPA